MRSQHSNQTTHILTDLSQGNIAKAKGQFLLLCQNNNQKISDWELDYIDAKISLYESSFDKASQVFQKLMLKKPQDISIKLNKALCCYQLGEILEWKDLLTGILKQVKPFLESGEDLSEHLQILMFLAKMLSEDCRHYDAQLILDHIALNCELDAESLLHLNIQRLRLSTEMLNISKIEHYYQLILQGQFEVLDFELERAHALLWADAVLIGLSAAKERWQTIQKNNLAPADRSFFLSEWMEINIIYGNENDWMNIRVPEKLEIQNCSVHQKLQFEIYINWKNKKLIKKTNNKIFQHSSFFDSSDDISFAEIAKLLPGMSMMRLLRQQIIIDNHHPASMNWQARYQLLIRRLDDPQMRLGYQLKEVQSSKSLIFEADFKNRRLRYGDRTIVYDKPVFWKIIQALYLQPQKLLSTSNAIVLIYEEIENQNHFDRLRIAIQRINKDLNKFFGLSPFIRITKLEIYLLHSIEVNYEN